MRIRRVETSPDHDFSTQPEILPGLLIGRQVAGGGETYWWVVNEQVAVDPAGDDQPAELDSFFEKVWSDSARHKFEPKPDAMKEAYDAWIGSLDSVTLQSSPPSPPALRVLMASGPPTGSPPGHLPFRGQTYAGEKFYRFEAWPTSRRLIAQTSGSQTKYRIKHQTFASPKSELPFLPTGFAAVARNALPSLFPACFKYELEPVAPAPMRCGAIVPQFGQSGGGVEVMFDDPHGAAIDNSGPFIRTMVPPL